MFTHEVKEAEAAAFSRFLGVPLVSTAVLLQQTERRNYLAACGNCRSIFLDPDTGVRLHRREAKRSPEFIFADELLEITRCRADGLVLVFDQSVARGSERQQVQAKLDYLTCHGVAGFAYISQAPFLILSQSSNLMRIVSSWEHLDCPRTGCQRHDMPTESATESLPKRNTRTFSAT